MFSYIYLFCRFGLLVLFAFSFITKLKDWPEFVTAIKQFQLVPPSLSYPVAILVLLGEGVCVILLAFGRLEGFVLAGAQLVIFSLALWSVWKRNMRVACHCFGKTDEPVSLYEIGRNMCFASCALLGMVLFTSSHNALLPLEQQGVVFLVSITLVMLVLGLKDIIQFLQFDKERVS